MAIESPQDPFARFAALFAEAQAAMPVDPNAMVLATVDADGRPSARVVLLKGFDARGFVFYTNLHSRKGRALAAHPQAALCFHFKPLERQVRVEGLTEPVTDAEADAYFATRARGSQVGAWASHQSEPLDSRQTLEARVAEVEARFPGTVPRPPFWSGFRLVPDRIEFWNAGASRLHDRFVYSRASPSSAWSLERLYP